MQHDSQKYYESSGANQIFIKMKRKRENIIVKPPVFKSQIISFTWLEKQGKISEIR